MQEEEAGIRIVSQDSSRASASRIYLNDEEISHLVTDVKVSIGGAAKRWNVELTLIAQVDIDACAQIQFDIKPIAIKPQE